MEKVLEYCQHYLENPKSDWDVAFCQVSQEDLFGIIRAANYLDIKTLLNMTCSVVANMIKGKTPEEIRTQFGIENDFSKSKSTFFFVFNSFFLLAPEEEEQMRKETEWLK